MEILIEASNCRNLYYISVLKSARSCDAHLFATNVVQFIVCILQLNQPKNIFWNFDFTEYSECWNCWKLGQNILW